MHVTWWIGAGTQSLPTASKTLETASSLEVETADQSCQLNFRYTSELSLNKGGLRSPLSTFKIGTNHLKWASNIFEIDDFDICQYDLFFFFLTQYFEMPIKKIH